MDDFEHVGEIINTRLTGKEIGTIDRKTLDAFVQDVFGNTFMSRYLLDALQAVQARQKTDRVFFGGTSHLFSQPEFQDLERIKGLLAMLEEEGLVKDMLTVGEESGLQITIGSENKFSGIQNCSMVQATYRLNGQTVGTFAVLGPTRMKYGKIISVMDYLHKYLRAAMGGLNNTNPEGKR
jgi:heat-inducible transcriptional repressor